MGLVGMALVALSENQLIRGEQHRAEPAGPAEHHQSGSGCSGEPQPGWDPNHSGAMLCIWCSFGNPWLWEFGFSQGG